MSNEAKPAPVHYLLPLFPGFQLLDVAGPLDILNLLSVTHSPAKSITLTLIASTLDPVPTKPIPPVDPTTGQPRWTYTDFPQLDASTNLTFTQSLTPTVTFASYLSALSTSSTPFPGSPTLPPIDVLLIPGGLGTRMTRLLPSGEQVSNVADLTDFVRRVAPHVRHSIVTVCTGSAVLAATGLLDGRRATTNMTRFDDLAATYPSVRWQKARRWVKSPPAEAAEGFKGDVYTSAGVSAGIDVVLACVAEWYGGVEVARTAARRLEYEWREVAEGEIDPLYGFSREDLGE